MIDKFTLSRAKGCKKPNPKGNGVEIDNRLNKPSASIYLQGQLLQKKTLASIACLQISISFESSTVILIQTALQIFLKMYLKTHVKQPHVSVIFKGSCSHFVLCETNKVICQNLTFYCFLRCGDELGEISNWLLFFLQNIYEKC